MRLDQRLPINSVEDAIRWACVLEATAPKVGNVHPSASFKDLNYRDFVRAAETTAVTLPSRGQSMGRRIEQSVLDSRSGGSNVNLGIVLLLAPMIQPALNQDLNPSSIGFEIASWTADDAANIYRTIAGTAGGLGNIDEMDVRDASTQNHPPQLIDAMKASADRDRIARQYATSFVDLFENVVPVLQQNLDQCCDTLAAISSTSIELLSMQSDSLIARKVGDRGAEEVRKMAASTNPDDPRSVAKLDAFLRRDGNRYNPGTTADLIAAALFALFAAKMTTTHAPKTAPTD